MNASQETVPRSKLEEAWERETHRLVVLVFRRRALFTPFLGLTAFVAFLLLEPVPWKLVWTGLVTLVITALGVFEYWRIRHQSATPLTIQFNIIAILLIQSAMIYITGGIESPILPIYVPLGFATGLSLKEPRRILSASLLSVFFTLLFACGAQMLWFPRATPSFFQLGQGFIDATPYIWVRASVICALILITSLIGRKVRQAYETIVREVFDARQATLETLVSRNREILSISRTIAHELKNPLSSIQGLAQLMARQALPGSKDRERLDVMLREITRMGSVLDEFRRFARPLSDLSVSKIRLDELVSEVLLLNEGDASRKGLSVKSTLEPVTVTCDEAKIQQALLNLVQNALEASPSHSTIEVSLAKQSDSTVRITISDEGQGLDPTIQDRLFTPGVTSKKHGSGIGLVVARSVTEQHGGTLRLENRAEGGCQATLVLPTLTLGAQEEDMG